MVVRAGARTARFAVLGFPLRGSLSPVMHNAAFRALGTPAVYVPVEVRPGALRSALDGLRSEGLRGANVTAPLKREAWGLRGRRDAGCGPIESANTLDLDGGELAIASTDGEGFLVALADAALDVAGLEVACLGAGGAGRAVAHALARSDAHVTLFARRSPAVEGLARQGVTVRSWTWDDDARAALGAARLVVNAAGAGGDTALPWEEIDPETFCVDMRYGRELSEFLRSARGRGCRARDGRGMLLHQGAASYRRWLRRDAPLEVMAEAIGYDPGADFC